MLTSNQELSMPLGVEDLGQLKEHGFVVVQTDVDNVFGTVNDAAKQLAVDSGLTNYYALVGDTDSQTIELPHVEAIYTSPTPRHVILGGVTRAETGGTTKVLNGTKLGKRVLDVYPELLDATATHSKDGRGKSSRKLIDFEHTEDPILRWRVLSSNDTDMKQCIHVGDPKRPATEYIDGVSKIVMDAVHDPTVTSSVDLSPGTVLAIDNWATLHARERYTGRRVVYRAQVDNTYTPHLAPEATDSGYWQSIALAVSNE